MAPSSQNKVNLKIRSKNFIEMFFTSLAWVLLVALAAWVLASVGWFLLYLIWQRELLLPEAIPMTAIAFLYISVFALVIYLALLVWARINYYFYYRKNRRIVSLPANEVCCWNWSEAMINTEKHNYTDYYPGSDLLLIVEEKEIESA